MMYNDYLMHHGVKGMHWGVRRYQNKDGTLTEEGKRHYNQYITSEQNRQKVLAEADKLIKKNKRLNYDFGKASNIDDFELFDYTRREYGIKSSSFEKAYNDDRTFRLQNSKSIEKGRKIAKKLQAAKAKQEAKAELDRAYAYADKNGISRRDYFKPNNRDIDSIVKNYGTTRSNAKKLVKYSEMLDEYKTNKRR